MPTIKEKLYFNYDGMWSDSFGLINVSLDGGMFDETLIASRELSEIKIRGNSNPLFQGLESSPLEFEMTIAFEDGFDDNKLNDVIRWLFTDYYKPLYFAGQEDKIFYCIAVDESRIVHNGLNQGYFVLKMRCNSPFVYSPVMISEYYDLSDGQKTIIELFNDGYGDLYPEISIEKIDVGNISIKNLFNDGEMLQINNLSNLEKIYINCKKEIVESDIIGVYRYNETSGIFPRLSYGRNLLEIEGKCRIQFRYQYKYRF